MPSSPSNKDSTTSITNNATTLTSTQRQSKNQSSSGGNTHGKSLLEAKVVILGTQGVGKTSLVHRYTSGHFNASSIPSTIGASFLTKKLLVDGTKVRLQIWDTAGQERFRSMAPMYYRGSNAAVIVYDITSMESFLDIKTWLEELRKNMNSDLIIHIVGSKSDLNLERKIDLIEAKRIIRGWIGRDCRFGDDDDDQDDENGEEENDDLDEKIEDEEDEEFGRNSKENQNFNSRKGKGKYTEESRNSLSKLNLFGTTNLGNENSRGGVNTFRNNVNVNDRGTSRFGNTSSLSTTLNFRKSSIQSSNSNNQNHESKTSNTNSPNSNSSNSSNENQISDNHNNNQKSKINQRNPSSSSFNTNTNKDSNFNFILISEVSAKDDEGGIEDVFLNLTSKLVERKLEIEKERRRRDRESIMIDSNVEHSFDGRNNDDGNFKGKENSGWSCC